MQDSDESRRGIEREDGSEDAPVVRTKECAVAAASAASDSFSAFPTSPLKDPSQRAGTYTGPKANDGEGEGNESFRCRVGVSQSQSVRKALWSCRL